MRGYKTEDSQRHQEAVTKFMARFFIQHPLYDFFKFNDTWYKIVGRMDERIEKGQIYRSVKHKLAFDAYVAAGDRVILSLEGDNWFLYRPEAPWRYYGPGPNGQTERWLVLESELERVL